jgi:acyl carrier protein
MVVSLDTLKQAFESALGLPASADWTAVQYGSTTGWDSMAHMQLITELETRFNIMLSSDQVINLGSFDAARQIIESHGIVFEP